MDNGRQILSDVGMNGENFERGERAEITGDERPRSRPVLLGISLVVSISLFVAATIWSLNLL